MAIKNFPPCEIFFQLAGAQSVRPLFFARLVDVNDGNQDAAGRDAALGRLKKISLQVVTDRNESPPSRFDLKFAPFEVGDDCIDLQATFRSAGPQNFDGCVSAVDGSDIPAVFCKPQSVSASAAGKIESLPRNEFRCGGYEERRGLGVQIFRGVFAQAVAFIPIVNFHANIVLFAGNDCKAQWSAPSFVPGYMDLQPHLL